MVGPLTSNDPVKEIPHKYVQPHVSLLITDTVKLKTKMNHNSIAQMYFC